MPSTPTVKPNRAISSARHDPWLELDTLAQHYLALPPGESPERDHLRKSILRLLAVGWVRFTAESEAERTPDVLSRSFREQARYLAHGKGNNRLVDAYGGIDNLSDEAKAEFLTRKASKFGKANQTLLTGLLSDWNPAKGGLRVFMKTLVRHFLLDLYDKCHGKKDPLKSAPGATPRGFLTDAPPEDGEEPQAHDDGLGRLVQTSSLTEPYDLAESVATEELYLSLEAAVQALTPAERKVYDTEIRRYRADEVGAEKFTDTMQTRALGFGSRNTLYKWRADMQAALRKALVADGQGSEKS